MIIFRNLRWSNCKIFLFLSIFSFIEICYCVIIEEWFSGLKESLSEYFLITVSLCYFFLLYFSWKLIRGNFSGDNENISYLDSKVIKINKYVIYSKIDEVMLEKEKLEKQLSFYKNNIDMDSKTEIKIRIDQINQIIMILRKDL